MTQQIIDKLAKSPAKMINLDEHISNISIEVDGKIVTMGQLFNIDPDLLLDTFSKQAGRLAWVNMLAARAEAAYETIKAERQHSYARRDSSIRMDINDAGYKKPPEKAIEQEVIDNKEYQAKVRGEIIALEQFKMLRGLAFAMSQRGDMAQSIGARLRKEIDVPIATSI